VGAAINAATNLDGQAFVNGSTVEYRLNALSEAVAGDLSLVRSTTIQTQTVVEVGNANNQALNAPYNASNATAFDYTVAKVTVGTTTYYGVAYAANNATMGAAIAALTANMRAAGVDAFWDAANSKFTVNAAAAATKLALAGSSTAALYWTDISGAPNITWTAADEAGINAAGTAAKTGAPSSLAVTTQAVNNAWVHPYTTTYTTSSNVEVTQSLAVGGLSDANQVQALAAKAVVGSSSYWVIDYAEQSNDSSKVSEISAKVGSTTYTQAVTAGNIRAAVEALTTKINDGEVSYQATQVGETIHLGLATSLERTSITFQNSNKFTWWNSTDTTSVAHGVLKMAVTNAAGVTNTYYVAVKGGVSYAPALTEGLFLMVNALKAAGIKATWNDANQVFTLEEGAKLVGYSHGFAQGAILYGVDGNLTWSLTGTDKTEVTAKLAAVGVTNNYTTINTNWNATTGGAVTSVEGTPLTSGYVVYNFGQNWTSPTAASDALVAKVRVNGTTYYAAVHNAANPSVHDVLTKLASVLANAGINSMLNTTTGKLTIHHPNVTGLGLAVVDTAGKIWALRDLYDEMAAFTLAGDQTGINNALKTATASNGAAPYTATTLGADDNSNYTFFGAVERIAATDYANYSAGLPSVAVSGGIKLAAGAIVQNDVDDATTATAEVMTVTLAGSVVTGSVYNITLNGKTYSVTAAAGDTLTTLGTKLAAAVNADKTAVAEVWQVAINNATVLHAGDVLTVKINGTDFSYTVKATDTLQTARDGLLNAINGITSKQVFTVAVDGANLPAAGSKVSVTVDGQVVEYTVQASDTTAALVIAGLRKAVNEVALAKNVTTALDAAGHLVITHHDAVDGTFAATGTGVTGTDTPGVYGTAPIAGVHASIGGTEGVIKLVSSSSALTVVMTYKDTSVATPADVDVSAKDVNKVVAFNADSSSLVTATDAAGVVTLTSKAAGHDLQVTASVKPADVSVLEGAQHYYAYNGSQETFVWRDDAIVGNDTVSGFKIGEDKLNLVQVLKGASAALSDYITVTDAGAAGNVTLAIDADGDAATTADRFNIVLGGAGTGSVTLSSLIDQGSLLAPSALS
jgi:hypothetical protein